MRGRASLPAAISLGALALLAAPCAADDLSGRAILSWQTLESDVLTSSGLRQTYDARLERALTDAFRFRLSFRGEGSDGTSALDGADERETRFRQYQPGAEINWSFSTFQVQANYDDFRTDTSAGDLSDERRQRRIVGRLTWAPEKLPSLTVYGEQRSLKDAAASINQTETSAFEALDWSWKGLTLGQNARYLTLDDGGADFARKSTDVQGLARYENTFFGGRAAVSANVLVGATRLDERARSGQPVSVPIRVLIGRALYAHDDTPLDSRDKPLQDQPALVDGDFQKAAGVPLGPDGTSYQNLAVDMGRLVPLDEFRVHVRDIGGAPVRTPGFVRFDAYRSDDGLSWIPLPGGSRTSFDAALSAYLVDFAPTSARYFKVVSFGTNVLDTQVTEVEVYQHQTFGAGEVKRTDIRLGSGSATVSGRPTEWLTLGYYGLFNTNTQTSNTRPEITTSDTDQVFSAQVDPTKTVNLLARYEHRGSSQTDGFGQSLDAITATAHWAPLRTVDATLEYQRSNQDLAGRTSTSNAYHAHLYLRLLRSLDLSLDAGSSREVQSSDDRPATRVGFTAVTYAQLTEALKLTANVSYQKTSYEGGTPEGPGSGLLLPASEDARYWGELYWRPGPQLALTARLGYASSNVFSGLTQGYRVEWYPFARGTVSIGTIYEEDLDSVSNRRFRRVQLLPRWAINKSATLDLNYTVMSSYVGLADGAGSLSLTSRNFWATFTLAF